MYGLNAVALVFFGCINVVGYRLCKWRRQGITVLSVLLLSGNLFRYCIVYPFIEGVVRFPVEFSTVAYFAVPVILLTAEKKLHSWAAYSGLMAGFFYYMAMIAAGGPLYASYEPIDVFISMFCHGTIYFCGFVTIGTELCSAKDAPNLVLGVTLVVLRAAVLRPFVAGSEGLSDLHSAGRCGRSVAAPAERVVGGAARLLPRRFGAGAADDSRLLPQKSETVP